MKQNRFLTAYIFLIGITTTSIYISGLSSLVPLWGYLLGYFLIAFVLHFPWRIFRKKKCLSLSDFFIAFMFKVAASMSLGLIVLGAFFIYHNELRPIKMTQYTLTNEKQTLQFQTMSHIANPDFYSRVVSDLIEAKTRGYVLYYEGVLPGSQENHKNFNKALGVELEADTYTHFSKLYGVVHQDNNDFLGHVNDKDYNIDISIDDIMMMYEVVQAEGSEQNSQLPADLSSDVLTLLSDLNKRELALLRYVNRGILSFIIKSDALRNSITNQLGNKELFSIILNKRNEHLVDEIIARGDRKIFILYGMMHFDGVYDLLRENDPNWKIIEQSETLLLKDHDAR